MANRSLRNLETGETRGASLPKGKLTWACGITWCTGRPSGARTGEPSTHSQVVRRDGKALIPHGDLRLREGDTVVLYTQTSVRPGPETEEIIEF